MTQIASIDRSVGTEKANGSTTVKRHLNGRRSSSSEVGWNRTGFTAPKVASRVVVERTRRAARAVSACVCVCVCVFECEDCATILTTVPICFAGSAKNKTKEEKNGPQRTAHGRAPARRRRGSDRSRRLRKPPVLHRKRFRRYAHPRIPPPPKKNEKKRKLDEWYAKWAIRTSDVPT